MEREQVLEPSTQESQGQQNGQSQQNGKGKKNGNKKDLLAKRNYELQKKLRNLSSVTHDSNESIRRRKRRSQINKIKNKMHKKKRRDDEDGSQINNNSEAFEVRGYVQLNENKTASLRTEDTSFLSRDVDCTIPRDMVDKWGLRTGLEVVAMAKEQKNRPNPIAVEIKTVEGKEPTDWRKYPHFQSLTSVNPFEFFRLSGKDDLDESMKLLELLTPIGKGQRALIVAPPRTGKTVLMEKIVNGIVANHPDTEAFLLLIDERPEEVTHLSRKVRAKVFASCLDKPIQEHVALCRMVIETAQRKAEQGKDVVILLDSITRMARAFNNQLKSTGRTLTGGVDAQALHEPKKFFGAARKLEEGGSLSIIATALVQTGSQMDEVIFQEFKGTGNMELVLSRKVAEKRIYPAIDINMSGTRREELILPPEYYKAAVKFRRYLGTLSEGQQMQAAIQAMEKSKSIEDFVRGFA